MEKLKRYYNYKEGRNTNDESTNIGRDQNQMLNGEALLIDEIRSEGVRLGQSLHHIYIK